MNSIFLFYHHRRNIPTFALVSFIVLCIGIVVSVFYNQQIQDMRSIASGDLKLLVPIYPSNSATWDEAAATIPPAGSVLILSMGSSQFDSVEGGPGTGPNSQMVQRIRNAHANGWKVIGYVRTQPFPGAPENQRRNASFVRGDIDNFKSWYPEIDGIFYDEVIANLDYYKSLIAYGRGKFPGNLHILNPGWKISFEALATAADVTVVFEGTYNLGFQLDGFYRNYSTDRWAMLAMNVSDINVCKQVMNQAKNQNIGWLYCLQRVGGPNDNPWPVLPSYFTQMANEMRGTNPTPTATPFPAPTHPQNGTRFSLTLLLHGIGSGGDNANPNAGGNNSPRNPQRAVKLTILNSQNTVVANPTGVVAFDAQKGYFNGTVGLSEKLPQDSYTIKVQTQKYLIRQTSVVLSIPPHQDTVSIEPLSFVAGDTNGDNALNILDYNQLVDCYSDLTPAKNCSDALKKSSSDLDDNGTVNLSDYNLFIRELSTYREE